MNYRTLEIGIKVFLSVLVAYMVADAVNIIVRGALHTLPSFTMPEKIRKKIAPAPSPVSEKRTEMPTIADTLPPLSLMGTVVGPHPYAVIFDAGSNRQELYSMKGEVKNGWHIDKIYKNKVVLKKGEREESLEIKSSIETGQMKSGNSLNQKQETRNSMRLSPAEVESALSDLNKVMTQARVIPNIVEGKTLGYKIFNIVPNSIYTKIGIANNDIIERVNNVEINSPDMFYKLFQQIRNESRIALDLKRGEEKKSIVVEIR